MKLRSAALLAALAVAVAGCSTVDDGGASPNGSTEAAEPGVVAEGAADGSVSTDTAATHPDTSSDEALPAEVATMLEGYGVRADDGVRAAITTLDAVDQQRPLTVQGSVRTDDVVFSDGAQEITVPIPGDLVYVSVAPYVDQTHPRHFHALGGCQGELVDEEVHVHIVDHMGTTLVDEQVTTRAKASSATGCPRTRTAP